MALQQAGEVACTLGEVRNHVDLVIFWDATPRPPIRALRSDLPIDEQMLTSIRLE